MIRRFILLIILLIAIFLRFWQLHSLPPGFHLDESYEALEAWHIFTDASYRPLFLPGNFGVPALNAYANALMFGLFQLFGGEAGPVAMRTTAACFGVLGVGALYGLASEWQKMTKKASLSLAFPLLAAASLATLRWHIHFSRIGIEPIIVPLLWTSALWLLLRGWRTGHWRNFVGCGLLLAASMYTYQAAWIIPLLMLPTVLLLSLSKTEIGAEKPAIRTRQRIVGLLIAGIVAILFVAPFGWYIWQHPDIVTLRPSQVASAVGTDGADNTSIWRSIGRTAQMYSPIDPTSDLNARRNIPGEPVLNFWETILFLAGLVVAIWRIRRPGYAILLLSLLGLLLPGALSQHAPHFHRLLGASAPTALLCALALDGLWQWRPQQSTHGLLLRLQAQLHWVSLLLLVLGGAVSAQNYFVRWANLPDLYYAFDVGLWQMGQEMAQMPASQPIYLTPKDADYPTLAFALRNHQHVAPIAFDGRHILPLTAQKSTKPELYAVIEHEDFRTRLLLPSILPTAVVQKEFLDRTGEVYARYYLRPANTTPEHPPQYPITAILGDGIKLLGYDVNPAEIHPGEVLYLQLHWLVDSAPTANWTVFTHVLAQDEAGNPKLVAGQDNPPGENSLPTSRWQAGWRLLDEYQITLPPDLAAGEYTLEIGMYQANGQHLPTTKPSILLGKVKIE
ncbi:hypothetical protein BH10CHL1_BH10CHL1_47290 [soil metagenome]